MQFSLPFMQKNFKKIKKEKISYKIFLNLNNAYIISKIHYNIINITQFKVTIKIHDENFIILTTIITAKSKL